MKRLHMLASEVFDNVLSIAVKIPVLDVEQALVHAEMWNRHMVNNGTARIF